QNDRLRYTNHGVKDSGCSFAFDDDTLKKYQIDTADRKERERSKVSIVDLEKSNNMLTTKALAESIGNVFVDGCDKGFYGNARGQIILAEEMIETFGLTAEQAYGKNFTWQYENGKNGNVIVDNDTNPNNTVPGNIGWNAPKSYLCYKYEVVGVIKKDISKKMREINNRDSAAPLNSAMIFARTSLVDDNGEILEPIITMRDDGDQYRKGLVATYTKEPDQLLKHNKQFIMIGANEYTNRAYYTGIYQNTNILFGAESYKDLDGKIADLAQVFKNCFGDGEASSEAKNRFGSSAFSNFNMIFTVFQYASLIMISIGGIIFFAAMVNLFNTIMHSVNSRKNYLGVMRAIGAQSNTIPKLYIFETLAIFRRALIWIAIFGGAICVGIKILIDMAFR
ncbi:MAG: ABC transporter permease, partial [Clostridia bacterium]